MTPPTETPATETSPAEPAVTSVVEIFDVASGRRSVVFETDRHVEAPNWSRDGSSLLLNGGGRLFVLDLAAPTGLRPLDTGTATSVNNDHGFSPDGTQIAISNQVDGSSIVFVLPSAGGEPRRVTAAGPSYWHGWSPDGSTLAYVGARNSQFDIYAIDVAGDADGAAEPRQLTDYAAPDDGPDYSPDGSTLYFNSARTGVMKIWAMNPDGSDQRQLTDDAEYADWFPHPSPDGRSVVLLSYDATVTGHPGGQTVRLRMLDVATGEVTVLCELFGGQGTINVPSWAPDSSAFAFVSYRQA
jgi:TolB protein